MKIQNVFRHLWILLVFEFFLLVSESPPTLPSLIPTVRLLNLFLLQTWCANMLTSLRKAVRFKNRFCTNMWLWNELIKLLIIPAFQLYCYFSTAVTSSIVPLSVVLSVWYWRIEYMRYIFVVLLFCADFEIATCAG
jgi:hypothetical protein